MVAQITMRTAIGLYENSVEKVGNLEEGDLPFEEAMTDLNVYLLQFKL